MATNVALPVVNAARSAQEGLSPLRLNISRYNRLTIAEQLFVMANLERVSRGEVPIYALTATLNAFAALGVRDGRDPEPGAGWIGNGFESIWSASPPSRTQMVFFADLGWVYEDGPPPYHASFFNADCSRRGMSGCWGHRDAILEPAPATGPAGLVLIAGAAGAVGNWHGQSSMAMFFTWSIGTPRSGVTYTWAQAVKFLGLPASYVSTTTTTTTSVPVPTTSTTNTTTTLGG
jgi:hypothetical protein